MQVRKEKNGWWLMLDRGEEIKSTISAWAKKNRVKGAAVFGIGAVEDTELGYFNENTRKFETRKFPGSYELISCIGNITEEGLHAHMSISNADFIARGGHLVEAKISVFGEFFVLPTKFVGRTLVPSIGLKGIDLRKKK